MLSMILKGVPAVVAAGGIYTSMQETNPILDYAKVTMVNYEMSTIARFMTYNAIGKNHVPTPKNFSSYLRESMQSSRDPALDYWDKPYVLEKKSGIYTIVSFGPDKKRGTSDDLRIEVRLP